MSDKGKGSLKPHFEDVQAHYDLSDDFFALFLDPTRTYSCAYFERDGYDAGRGADRQDRPGAGQAGPAAGDDAARRRLRLGLDDDAGDRALRRQRHRPDAERRTRPPTSSRCSRSRTARAPSAWCCKGWEQFDEPVDRIVSIGAFEHFGFDRYDDFFKFAYDAMPDDGVMLLHTITALTGPQMVERGMPLTFEFARFMQVHDHRDLPRRPAAVDREGRGAQRQGRLHPDAPPVAAAALRAHAGHLGRGTSRPTRTRRSPSSPKRSTSAT